MLIRFGIAAPKRGSPPNVLSQIGSQYLRAARFDIIDVHSVFRAGMASKPQFSRQGKNSGGGQYPFARECHASPHSYSEKRRDARLPDRVASAVASYSSGQ